MSITNHQKELETWEERWQKFIDKLSARQDNIGKMLAVSVIFKEEIGDFISQEIATTRTEAETRVWNEAIEAAMEAFVGQYCTRDECIVPHEILEHLKKV